MALTLNLSGETTVSDFFLGGGGFVMVACAELSKIPLATFFVEASHRGKLLTLAFLLLMSLPVDTRSVRRAFRSLKTSRQIWRESQFAGEPSRLLKLGLGEKRIFV
jgi:hypothetical protein